MKLKYKAVCTAFLWSILVLMGKVCAQTCTGSLGDPVVNIDFGRGTAYFGPALPAGTTNYIYVPSAAPVDGAYTIARNVESGAWFNTYSHTTKDPDGYFMMINASSNPGVFYEMKIDQDLCPNTTYEFAAWVTNLLKFDGIDPNLTFSILSLDNQVLGTYTTGDISETQKPEWKQHGFLFNTKGTTRVKIQIQNNSGGGTGNDLAIDDITFRACGASIKTWLDQPGQTEKSICIGDNIPVMMSAEVMGSGSLLYLWQRNDGSGWIDLNGETTTQLRVNPGSLTVGDHEYRLMAAGFNNFNNPLCRTASPLLTIHVKAFPKAGVLAKKSVCQGDKIMLDVSDTEGTYQWTGPNGYSSKLKSPVIENANPGMAGDYKVTVTTANCSADGIIHVTILSRPVPAVDDDDISICEGASTGLNASGGISYKWSPAVGLSATDVANPTASPVENTVYTVAVSNGGCEETASVRVTVIKKISVDAGTDISTLVGQPITLNGEVKGDRFRYLWSPPDYLDDPTKLKPVAIPLKDIIYTLTAWSEEKCSGSTDVVSVKVHEKLVVPNTFSPNGDGTNDLWSIASLDAYSEAEVNIYNRYGEKVFSASSGVKSWDGKCKGKDVPVGVYYYSINFHNGQKMLSGPLTVLR